MSPRTGRPPKSAISRSEKLNIRLTPAEYEEIRRCAEALGISRTDAILLGIRKLASERK